MFAPIADRCSPLRVSTCLVSVDRAVVVVCTRTRVAPSLAFGEITRRVDGAVGVGTRTQRVRVVGIDDWEEVHDDGPDVLKS